MFYQELCKELGKLFYHIAGIDGSVSPAKKRGCKNAPAKHGNRWKVVLTDMAQTRHT